jgi:microcystin-dependent protein
MRLYLYVMSYYPDTGDLTPIGTLLPYGGASAPPQWLFADGTAISRTTYADLYAVMGDAYGAGDGSTTFTLPNLKGRVPVGLDATKVLSVERPTSAGAIPESLNYTESLLYVLGAKITFNNDGQINGLRFFRAPSAAETTRTLRLYSDTGTLLASANTVETGVGQFGWVSAMFAVPVEIVAGTTLVAAYDSIYLAFSSTPPPVVDPVATTWVSAMLQTTAGVFPDGPMPYSYHIDFLWQPESLRSPEFVALNSPSGEITHLLSVAELASHTHLQNSHNHTQSSHNHGQSAAHNHTQTAHSHGSHTHDARNPYKLTNGGYPYQASGYLMGFSTGDSTAAYYMSIPAQSSDAPDPGATGSNHAATCTYDARSASNDTAAPTNSDSGGGLAHNNLQPYKVLNYIIRSGV